MMLIKEGYGKLFSFHGRTSVKDFWLFIIFSTIVYLLAYAFAAKTQGIRDLYTIIYFLSTLSIQVRRLHDAGKSGGYILFWIIPIIGALILLFNFFRTDAYENRFGLNPEYSGNK